MYLALEYKKKIILNTNLIITQIYNNIIVINQQTRFKIEIDLIRK